MTQQPAPSLRRAPRPGRPGRPPELTIVAVLTYIGAIVGIISGVLLILLRYVPDASDELRRFVTIGGAVVILSGFMTVAVASGISRGDRHARIILTILSSLSIAIAAVFLVSSASDVFRLSELLVPLIDLVVSAAMIVAMWTGRARRYFAHSAS